MVQGFIHAAFVTAHKFPAERLKAYQSLNRVAKRSRRSRATLEVIDFTDPADCIVHVVYPTEIDALVSLTHLYI